MAAIGVFPAQPIQPQPVSTSKSCLQTLKETALRIWSSIIHIFQSAGSQVSFVFFRALEWINPNMALRVENAWVRMTNIWHGVKEVEAEKEMDALRERVLQTRDYEQIARARDQALQTKNHAEEVLRLRQNQEKNLLQRENAVIGQRDILQQKNAELQAENAQLTQEINQAKQQLAPLHARQAELAHQLALAQKQVADLQVLQPAHDEMKAQLTAILKAIPAPDCMVPPHALDHQLEQLLPLLLGQLDTALDQLAEAKQRLPKNSETHIIIESIERILTAFKAHHKETPELLTRHRAWQNPVNQLFPQPMAV